MGPRMLSNPQFQVLVSHGGLNAAAKINELVGARRAISPDQGPGRADYDVPNPCDGWFELNVPFKTGGRGAGAPGTVPLSNPQPPASLRGDVSRAEYARCSGVRYVG